MKIKQLLATFSVGAALTAIGADEMTRIIGYNVLIGFNRAERIEETASWLREKKPDVVLFQGENGQWNKKICCIIIKVKSV